MQDGAWRSIDSWLSVVTGFLFTYLLVGLVFGFTFFFPLGGGFGFDFGELVRVGATFDLYSLMRVCLVRYYRWVRVMVRVIY